MNEKPIRSIFLEASAFTTDSDRIEFVKNAYENSPELAEKILRMLGVNSVLSSLGDATGEDVFDDFSMQTKGSTHSCVIAPSDSDVEIDIDSFSSQFEDVKKIDEGGTSEVFSAIQVSPVRRKVALKVVKAGLDSNEITRRFIVERQILERLNHPSIARILGSDFTTLGRPFLIIEFIDGCDIHEYCRINEVQPRQRLEILCKVCDAVQYLHQNGFIHRDLKPRNILVSNIDGNPTPFVVDFGIAKVLDPKSEIQPIHTHHGQLLGTLEYLSPEQASLGELPSDTRTDVYALAAVLYELLCDESPFRKRLLASNSLMDSLRIIREEVPEYPSKVLKRKIEKNSVVAKNRVFSEELNWVALRGLCKQPEQRYESVRDLADDLRRSMRFEIVHARPVPFSHRLSKFVRRNRGSLISSGLVLGLISLCIGLAISGRLQTQQHRQQITEKNAQIESKEEQIKEKNEEIESKEKDLGKLNQQIKEKNEEIEGKEKDLGKLNQQIIEKNEEIESKVKDLGKLNQRNENFLNLFVAELRKSGPVSSHADANAKPVVNIRDLLRNLLASTQRFVDDSLIVYRDLVLPLAEICRERSEARIALDALEKLRAALLEKYTEDDMVVVEVDLLIAQCLNDLNDRQECVKTVARLNKFMDKLTHSQQTVLKILGCWNQSEAGNLIMADSVLQGLDQNNKEVLFLRGKIANKEGDYSKAAEIYLNLSENTKDPSFSLSSLKSSAENLIWAKRYVEAEQLLRKVAKEATNIAHPDHMANFVARGLLIECFIEQGKYQEGIDLCLQLEEKMAGLPVDAQPNAKLPMLHLRKAFCYMELGQYVQTHETLTQIELLKSQQKMNDQLCFEFNSISAICMYHLGKQDEANIRYESAKASLKMMGERSKLGSRMIRIAEKLEHSRSQSLAKPGA